MLFNELLEFELGDGENAGSRGIAASKVVEDVLEGSVVVSGHHFLEGLEVIRIFDEFEDFGVGDVELEAAAVVIL